MTRSRSTAWATSSGWMGEGDKIIAIDSHIDTVGIGNIDNWDADPYQGYEDRRGHLRPRRLRPGGRHGLCHLRLPRS